MTECKVCVDCKQNKQLDEYYNDKRRPDGLDYRCKICAKARKEEFNYKRKYGITLNIYHEMEKSQDYKCKVCGTPELESGRKRMNVDHCHITGKVRGLLCGCCNRAIGQLRDSPELLRRAADYLEENK